MGRHQRQKGVRGEREAADCLSSIGIAVERLARNGVDGASDLAGQGIVVEVKRRRSLIAEKWLSQCEESLSGYSRTNDPETLCALMMRGDNGRWILAIRADELDGLCQVLRRHRIAIMDRSKEVRNESSARKAGADAQCSGNRDAYSAE